ncbi:hypothetical protein JCGZ_05775 [Jatropha curcas]|uniref:Fanconi-associated nuclease n=1 Tax=Jatropha curcas TaxID=180498 RepID=A0A067KSB7_JATCU|nr:hypothetical protein JCGZ_05775 [Jatropha curcas]
MGKMLTGRESLIRLVGKRRRFLPNRQSLLYIPVQDEKRFSENKMEEDEKSLLKMSTKDWVACPVCGSRVRGEDCVINSHLDACLLSGKKRKRKLTQRTLLQLDFCSHTSSVVQNTVIDLKNSVAAQENDSNPCQLSSSTEPIVVKAGLACSVGKPIDEDRISCQVDPSSLLLKDEVPTCDPITTLDDISEVLLETYIVGRRFSVEKDLNLGARISLLRDPDNPKDPNAIKVLLADSTHPKVLGFLPRELAEHLSPLIEKYSLTFKGHVTSVPKLSLDVVPIQIVCCEVISHGDRDRHEIEDFTHLWKNLLHVVESAKNYASSTIKYQHNFCLLLQEVLRSNTHLFTDDEKNYMGSSSNSWSPYFFWISIFFFPDRFLMIFYRYLLTESFLSLPDDSQRLFVRLYTRKAVGYICSIEDAKELQKNQMEEILNLLTVSELREITSIFKKRLFFLNGEQNLSSFLLVDLGVVKYPSYSCIISEQIFSTRSNLLAYEEAIEVAQIMDESLEQNDNELVLTCIRIADSRMSNHTVKATQSMSSESAAIFLSYFSASWVYSKVVLLGISFLESERRYKDAVKLLEELLACFPCDGRRGYWTLRLSIDLEHMGCCNESLSVAEHGLLDQWVRAGSRMALQKRVLRLGKPPRRWRLPSFSDSVRRKVKEVHIQGRPLNCEIGKKSRFYGEDGEQCGVEQLALQYYAGEGGGWHGVHAESGIWLTIFALLMWDIIFSDVPNVFRNRFQTAPLDLETDGFYPVRKTLIESHLQKIQGGMAEEIIITSWELHSGTACKGVNWNRHSLSELRAAVTCIGGPCLASLCLHLAQDYRSWSSGMPDLLLWRFNGEYKGEAKLVEVKGPKDRLSEQQHAWLLLLMDCGFNTEVCKVSPLP